MFLPMTHEPRNSKDLTSAGAKHFKVASGSFRRPAKSTTVIIQPPLEEEDPKLTKAIARTKIGYQTHLDKKHARSIKVIGLHEVPEATSKTATKVTAGKCQAVTLTGKPCPWAKVGGTNHCKKHQVNVAAMQNL